MLPYSDADEARLEELAELYLACRAAFRDLTEETQSRPYPNSYAARDVQSLVARDPPIAETSEQLITWLVQLYLYAASEHLGGLGALYGRHEVLIAPLVLARSVLEHSAHSIWIIGNANDDPQDRLARAFLEELLGAQQAKVQGGRLLTKTSEEYGRPLSVNVRRDAHHRGINDLEGENGERRTWRRARMELGQRLRLLPPAAETSLA